jgi:hypothetical protein
MRPTKTAFRIGGRAAAIVRDVRDYHGLFVGYGKSAVFVLHDRNFDP